MNSVPPSSGADRDPAAPSLGEKLDQLYHDHKTSNDHVTTEIPISLLLSLDGIAAGNAETRPAPSEAPSPYKEELTAHLRRVAAYAELLALKYGLDAQEAKLVKQVCPMHDIGKWMIPEQILRKPGALNTGEWAIMKTHALAGYEILKDSKHEVLKLGAMVAMQHQEKYDGAGYPLGLRGEEIHLYSRITTVVDVFDALGSARSYKQPWSTEAIVEYFQRNRGTHFDPRLVDTLLGNMGDFVAIREGFGSDGKPAAP